MEYFVTCIKHSGSKGYRCVRFGKAHAEATVAQSQDKLELCDVVDIDGTDAKPLGSRAGIGDIIADADRISKLSADAGAHKSGIKDIDKALGSMWPAMLDAARLLIRKLVLGVPIIVRFHNDADGISGAYALYKSIEEFVSSGRHFTGDYTTVWLMNRGVTYATSDAIQDTATAGNFSSVDKPLLFIIDFGTSQGSNAGIKLLKERFDVIWLDHHPIEEGFAGTRFPFYINPWLHGGNSDITSGFLASAFSKTFSGYATTEIENASFIGDYSPFADKGAKGADMSSFLDMVTSDVGIALGRSSRNITPKDIDVIIRDEERYNELLAYSKVKMSETVAAALKQLKRYKAGECVVYVSDFDILRRGETKYPLPGRFSSKLLEELLSREKAHAVLLLHFGPFISIRVDTAIADKADVLGMIAELKDRRAEEIESGGGHCTAANVKLSYGYPKEEVLHELVSMLKLRLKGPE